MKNKPLKKLLEQRGMNVDALADQIFCNRTTVSLALSGNRPATPTWTKLKKVLNAQELKVAWEFAAIKLKLAKGEEWVKKMTAKLLQEEKVLEPA